MQFNIVLEQKVLAESVWLSTSGVETLKVTPTLIDGVTISASPNTKSATPWISLDKTGIPYRITPTVSGGTTISASPTPTDSNYPKVDDVPPVLRCFGDRVPNEDALGSPFCTAQNGTELLVGEIYWITWDPSYWGGDVSRVTLQMRAYPVLDNDSPLFTSEQLSNNDGYYPLEITPEMRRSLDAGYFFLNITPLTNQNSNAKHVGTKSGPVLRVITSRSEAITELSRVPSDNAVNTSKEGVKASTIAPAVIVPVVVAIALVAGIFWYLNKKKQAEAYAGNNRTYRVVISSLCSDLNAMALLRLEV
ncbi:hypothetical protein BABINDRAFT_171743 [Babjeviella inositovora NRRL Y-12698]|uniref:Uncharacterized protein n=1 Tax=Babjeviella inositovora NRRL Y-12698 TaxID=984486 RepID=A0A1E3QPL1_9ASCO|nr:uncharacterized protein BABINDRAFT_171743 [Babjeviella inositovora NRRL Y-12698]ODQ79578.1 hypothetical protein BABINDRAFT_171743 [Babjeviella inositovora NRRL Y-12698]